MIYYYDKKVMIYYDIIEKLWYHSSARFQMLTGKFNISLSTQASTVTAGVTVTDSGSPGPAELEETSMLKHFSSY